MEVAGAAGRRQEEEARAPHHDRASRLRASVCARGEAGAGSGAALRDTIRMPSPPQNGSPAAQVERSGGCGATLRKCVNLLTSAGKNVPELCALPPPPRQAPLPQSEGQRSPPCFCVCPALPFGPGQLAPRCGPRGVSRNWDVPGALCRRWCGSACLPRFGPACPLRMLAARVACARDRCPACAPAMIVAIA